MAKIQRQKVVIESRSYNFEKRYEQEMEQFDDKIVISITLLSSKDNGASVREEYLVFYQDLLDAYQQDTVTIEEGDFVYWKDVNTRAKIYETVECVAEDDGLTKVFFVKNNESEGGFVAIEEVTLIVKKKDRKDI